MLRILLPVLILASFFNVFSQENKSRIITPVIHPALKFTENAGQWDQRVLFRATLDGGQLYLEKNCLTYNFYDKKKYAALHRGALATGEYKDPFIGGHAYRVVFLNAKVPTVVKEQKSEGYENFFRGNDQGRWKGEVKAWHQVWLKNLYNKIDYEVITSANGLKYNFYVQAGADPSVIRMEYEGIDDIKLKDGSLIITSSVNRIIEQKPYAYQLIRGEVKTVACNYRYKNQVLSFEFPEGYNKDEQLVIDPVLVFSAQIGSTADNFGMTATFDAAGNLYSGGVVYDNGYPYQTGSYSGSFNGSPFYGNTDVFITKYNSSGTALIYSTYLGGTATEVVSSLVVDHNNNLCLYGATGSVNFPITAGATYTSFGGGTPVGFVNNGTLFQFGTDIFIAKFNAAGSSLLGSTYYGGLGNDGINYLAQTTTVNWPVGSFQVQSSGYDSLMMNYGDQYRGEIQVDSLNNIYVVSSTRSASLDIVNGFDNTLGGKQDALVLKFNSALSTLLYSSYLGGGQQECGNSVFVTPLLEIYVTGGTTSSNFPGTSGGHSASYNGGKADGFLSKINAQGNTLLQSTYIGTSSYDNSFFVQCDIQGNPYVFGQSLGSMPVQAVGTASIFSVANTHQFISKYNIALTQRTMSTKFGSKTNGLDISPSAFAIDECNGNIYLSGWGGGLITNTGAMSGMPLLNATQGTTTGFDFYLMALSPNAGSLLYGSYYGGSTSQEHVDGGTSRFDRKGIIYQSVCAGCGGNQDFPISSGAWPCPGSSSCPSPNFSSNCNNGVFKINFQLQNTIATINTNTISGCLPLTVTLTNASPGTGYVWNLGNGNTTSVIPNPVVTFTTVGTHSVSLMVIDTTRCVKKDSTVTYFTVHPSPGSSFSLTSIPCTNSVTTINTSTGTSGTTPFEWSGGSPFTNSFSSNTTFTFNQSGIHTVSLTTMNSLGCKTISTHTVAILVFTPGISNGISACRGSSPTITAYGGTSYTWNPGASLNNSIIASPVVTATANTIYTVTILNNTYGFNCVATRTVLVNILPLPTASFNIVSTLCTNTISTNNLSSGNLPASPYVWNFGDGSALNTQVAPGYVYNNDGTYTVSLTVTDVNGCKDTRTSTVSVLNFIPAVVAGATICNGQSKGLNAFGGTSYTWSPAASLNNAGIPNPVSNASASTVYTVDILNNSQGYSCSRSLTTTVQVNPTPTTAFSYTVNPCGGAVNFFDASQDDIVDWSWTLAPAITSTLQNPYYFYSKGGTFNVVLVTTNSYGCSNTLVKPVVIGVPPPVSVNDPVAICLGDKVQLFATGGTSYHWSPPASLDSPDIPSPTATPSVTTIYSVVIETPEIVNGSPCTYTMTTGVRVDVLSVTPGRAIAEPTMVIVGDPTTLTWIGDPGAKISWIPGNTTPATGYTVVAYPDKPTTYTAIAVKGACTKYTEVHVDAYTAGCIGEDVFIPNTFTPNGDGKNDVLIVRGMKVDEVYFAVYNRWGELVFETNDKDKGWDGIYKNKPADVGVFGWYLKVKCLNGAETFRKGNVTLIR